MVQNSQLVNRSVVRYSNALYSMSVEKSIQNKIYNECNELLAIFSKNDKFETILKLIWSCFSLLCGGHNFPTLLLLFVFEIFPIFLQDLRHVRRWKISFPETLFDLFEFMLTHVNFQIVIKVLNTQTTKMSNQFRK